MIFLNNLAYMACFAVFVTGLAQIAVSGNLLKKLAGLAMMQAGVISFFISLGYVSGAAAPILGRGAVMVANPLPQVLMLTAIVVGLAVMAVGLAIASGIKKEYGTIEEDEIMESDRRKEA